MVQDSTTDGSVAALPSWVTAVLVGLMAVIITAMFVVTIYNLSAPRSTLKNLLGIKGVGILRRRSIDPPANKAGLLTPRLMSTLALSAQVNTRTTRTTLAIAGFALLGTGVVAVFALGGPGVRDLRTQVMAGVVTLVASIAGFYFGQSSSKGKPTPDADAPTPTEATAGPTLAEDVDDRHRTFTVGTTTSYQPVVNGVPTPTLALLGDLPEGLSFDRATGRISGKPLKDQPNGSQIYPLQIVATNGIEPDQVLAIELTVQN